MEFVFTTHVVAKIADFASFGVTKELVIATVNAPEQLVPGSDTSLIAQSRLSHQGKTYLLRIAYQDYGTRRHLITVYVTSQVRRYWKKEE
jgi:hypothetical protein